MLVVSYEMNVDYVTKTYCENRKNPKMHCNGKCHLVKEMKDEDKRESSSGTTIFEKYLLLLFSEEHQIALNKFFPTPNKYSSTYLIIPYSTYLSGVYHPPCC